MGEEYKIQVSFRSGETLFNIRGDDAFDFKAQAVALLGEEGAELLELAIQSACNDAATYAVQNTGQGAVAKVVQAFAPQSLPQPVAVGAPVAVTPHVSPALAPQYGTCEKTTTDGTICGWPLKQVSGISKQTGKPYNFLGCDNWRNHAAGQ